jgi:hypothetical protein
MFDVVKVISTGNSSAIFTSKIIQIIVIRKNCDEIFLSSSLLLLLLKLGLLDFNPSPPPLPI